MIYVIDHNDSFTHNVVHQFSLFDEVECDNYNEIDKKKLQKAKVIVFSPGPGNPRNYPTTSKIYKKFKGKKKMIGICLGFQQILFCEGAKIIEQKKIYHGFQSDIKVVSEKKILPTSNTDFYARDGSLMNQTTLVMTYNICMDVS